MSSSKQISGVSTTNKKNKKKQVLEKIRKDNLRNINQTTYFTMGNNMRSARESEGEITHSNSMRD
jgi:hypothetical protein